MENSRPAASSAEALGALRSAVAGIGPNTDPALLQNLSPAVQEAAAAFGGASVAENVSRLKAAIDAQPAPPLPAGVEAAAFKQFQMENNVPAASSAEALGALRAAVADIGPDTDPALLEKLPPAVQEAAAAFGGASLAENVAQLQAAIDAQPPPPLPAGIEAAAFKQFQMENSRPAASSAEALGALRSAVDGIGPTTDPALLEKLPPAVQEAAAAFGGANLSENV